MTKQSVPASGITKGQVCTNSPVGSGRNVGP